MGVFRSVHVRQLLHNKFVVVLGDSIQRSVYKDLVKILQSDKFLSEAQLKRKGEFSFENDSLVEGGQMNELHNGTTFREVRQYRSGHHLVRFYFLTRVYSAYLESILSDFQSGPQPDVLILNSCIWDVNRYSDQQLEGYKTNLEHLCMRLKEVLSPQCLIIWSTTMPVGYRNSEIPENTVHNLRKDMVEGNFFSATLADFHKLDVLDMHYHFRCDLHLRCRDGVHWNQVAHRKYTQILLTHIALTWGIEPPKGVMAEGSPLHAAPTRAVELRKNPKLRPAIKERAQCGQGDLYPRYYDNEMRINSEAVSPFVTDSPLLSTNITPGYFCPPPGPSFTRAPFSIRNFNLQHQAPSMTFDSFSSRVQHPQENWTMRVTPQRVQARRDGWMHPYSRPPVQQRRMY
ncbi:PC-esterase domain-containing protein 1A-like isoform X2 [Ranitomeya variabilis]|uniref:PC-esterase domain-containing protein 1A-like isoform X2 n=1 Tax=Ranitomeya variabilis TaxID=490064 RepID=UPI00405790EB